MNPGGSSAARLIQIAFLAICGIVWYELTVTRSVSPLFLPPLERVRDAFMKLVQTGEFWSAVRVTLTTIVQAYLYALVAGVAVAWLVTRSKFATDVVEPMISGLFSVPLTLFFPLFILFFGIGPASKVAYAGVYGFFPVTLATIAGLRGVDRLYLRAARSMGASPWDTFRHVLFPAAFPVILTGFRVGFFVTFASVLGGETLSSAAGIGRHIAMAAELMEPARMFAWILFVILTAISLNMLVSYVESRAREY